MGLNLTQNTGMAPDVPKLPEWSKLKIFLWGAVWAILTALAPVAMTVWDWVKRWDDPLDWGMIGHQAMIAGAVGLFAYWRKYEAWLLPPPDTTPANLSLKQSAERAAGNGGAA